MSYFEDFDNQVKKHERLSKLSIEEMVKHFPEDKKKQLEFIKIKADYEASKFKERFIAEECKKANINLETDYDRSLRAFAKSMSED
ncbi:MAG: hypothetical protein IKE59_04595 [Erysipelotrichaceae bacterium]|nr:hypothetical protein [Erysipelotrichaceae bacterium]